MTYVTEHIAGALKAARERKHLSQRALSSKAGVPQSHISRIERAEVDLRLSSLITLARVLDLELLVVPRRLVPAVQSLVRGAVANEDEAQRAARIAKEVQRLDAAVRKLQRYQPQAEGLEQVRKATGDLQRLSHISADPKPIREATQAIWRALKSPQELEHLRATAAQLQQIRNAIAHAVPRVNTPQPAYGLNEEDEYDG